VAHRRDGPRVRESHHRRHAAGCRARR
jgi:hypothetical protein